MSAIVVPDEIPAHAPVATRSVLVPPPSLLNQPLVRLSPCMSSLDTLSPNSEGSSAPRNGSEHCVAVRARSAT